MVQPVNLQLAHFNVEHSAQISKEAIAAAQQTGQGQEVVQESVRRTQRVEAGLAAAEPQKVKRKGDEEEERKRDQSFSEKREPSKEDEKKTSPSSPAEKKGFELYA